MFTVPTEIRANWIFRMTELDDRGARARMSCLRTRVAPTSRPEEGSSRMTISGSCSSTAAIRIFWRMPFE